MRIGQSHLASPFHLGNTAAAWCFSLVKCSERISLKSGGHNEVHPRTDISYNHGNSVPLSPVSEMLARGIVTLGM